MSEGNGVDDGRLARIEEAIVRISDRVSLFDRHVVEFNLRFENGQRSFAANDKRLTEIEAQLRPSIARIAAYLAGFLFTLGTTLWGAAFMFSMRPTFSQVIDLIENRPNPGVSKRVEEHDKTLAGHGSTLDRLEVKLGTVLDTVNEIKIELRERRTQ